jgi:hypothetical protein
LFFSILFKEIDMFKLLIGIGVCITLGLELLYTQSQSTVDQTETPIVEPSQIIGEPEISVTDSYPAPPPSTEAYPYPAPEPYNPYPGTKYSCDLWWLVCDDEPVDSGNPFFPTAAPTP